MSGERPLLRDTRPAWEQRGRLANLSQERKAGRCWFELGGELPRGNCKCLEIGALPNPQHSGASRCHKRQAPLGGHRRVGKRLGDRPTSPVDLLLFCTTPDRSCIWWRPFGEELPLATFRIQQHEFSGGKRERERDPGHAPTRPDIHNRPIERRHKLEPFHGVVVEIPLSGGAIERCQPGCRDDGVKPGCRPFVHGLDRRDNNEPLRFVAVARRLNPVEVFQSFVDDPPFGSGHWLKLNWISRLTCVVGSSKGKRLKCASAAIAVPGSIDDNIDALVRLLRSDRSGKRLERIDRRAVLANQQTEIIALTHGDDPVLGLTHLDLAVEIHCGYDTGKKCVDSTCR